MEIIRADTQDTRRYNYRLTTRFSRWEIIFFNWMILFN